MNCSECGAPLDIAYLISYKYKTTNHDRYKSKDKSSSQISTCNFQCSYTCYDHALLRYPNAKKSLFNYDDHVIRSEQAMRAQGKTILNPIQLGEK